MRPPAVVRFLSAGEVQGEGSIVYAACSMYSGSGPRGSAVALAGGGLGSQLKRSTVRRNREISTPS